VDEKAEPEIPKLHDMPPRPRRRRAGRPRVVLSPGVDTIHSVTACGENRIAIAFDCSAMISRTVSTPASICFQTAPSSRPLTQPAIKTTAAA